MLEVLSKLAADGVRLRCFAFQSLNLYLNDPMAWVTEGGKITEIIGRTVICKQSVRLDVVDITARQPAPLADVAIAFSSGAFLCCPIRPSIIIRAMDKLRMKFADAICITTRARAVFSAALMSVYRTFLASKSSTAAYAGKRYNILFWSSLYSGILTGWRAVHTAAVPDSGRDDTEHQPTLRAWIYNHLLFAWASVSTSQTYITACIGAIFSTASTVFSYKERLGTYRAGQLDHYVYVVGRP